MLWVPEKNVAVEAMGAIRGRAFSQQVEVANMITMSDG